VDLPGRRPKIIVGALGAGHARAGRRAGRRGAAELPCPPAMSRGPCSRSGAAAAPRPTPTCTSTPAAGKLRPGWPAATCSPTPSSMPTPPASPGPASATRSPPSGPPTGPVTGPPTWPPSPIR
jgi:hypothetical protein